MKYYIGDMIDSKYTDFRRTILTKNKRTILHSCLAISKQSSRFLFNTWHDLSEKTFFKV